MWLDILSCLDSKRSPMINIKPPPPDPYELRVVIWGVRDMTIKDTFTNQNDLYVTCQPSVAGLKTQETDTHYRSKGGKGNFNWRMKWPLSLPPKKGQTWPRLRFQIWDKDFFSPNDSICETVISIKGLCKQALKAKDRTKIMIGGKEKIWLENLRHPNEPGTQGRMEVSVELLPEHIAHQLPAGFGRGDPNQNPFLPPPEGRISLSLLHPLDACRDLLGDRLFFKLCCGLLICTILGIAVSATPMIVSNVFSRAIGF